MACAAKQIENNHLSAFYNAAVTPLVFLHGVGGGHSAWDAQVSHFSRLGYACLAWDQPGYGGGEPLVEPYSLQAITEELRKQLENPPVMPTMRGGRSDPAGLAHAEERIAVPTLLVARTDDKTAPPSILRKHPL